MLFIIYTTGRCNLSCSYCGGSFPPKVVSWRVRYNLQSLRRLITDDDVVAFYGGEPLLNVNFIKKVIDALGNHNRYVLQTNGILLDKVPPEILHAFDTILVSIDGVEWITDKYRGRGVYERVVKNVRKILSMGYSGDIVARMTINEDSDIYRDVRHLIDLGIFSHVHWQLNLVWTERNSWKDLSCCINNNYAPGLRSLLEEWISELKTGNVLGIAPFQGVVKRLLGIDNQAPPCGSGVDSFTILPDGRIISCPIAVSEKWARIGLIGEIERSELQHTYVKIDEPCVSCSYYQVCGGRCLYTHIERLWGEEGFRTICTTSKLLINLITERISDIKNMISNGIVSLDDVIYPKYNNTVEIIP